MAIECKGLSYFSVDVNFFESEKMLVIVNDFGFEAVAMTLKLYSQIYKSGFFIKWNDKISKILSASIHSSFGAKELQKLVLALVEEEVFDKTLFEKYQILTSREIQLNYFSVTAKRKWSNIEHEEYLLVDLKKPAKADGNTKKSEAKQNDAEIIKEENAASLPVAQIVEKKVDIKDDWKRWRKELLEDEDWKAMMVRFAGKGIGLIEVIEEALMLFEDYVLLTGKEYELICKKEYQRAFSTWWRYNRWTLNMDELRGNKAKTVPKPSSRREPESMIDKALKCAKDAQAMVVELNHKSGFI